MFRISDATSLAMHTMVLLAGAPGEVVSTRRIAGALNASEAHLSKVLQRMVKAGLVRSIRGPKGGFQPARPCDTMTLLDIYEAIEGPLIEKRCLLPQPVCDGTDCILGELLAQTNQQMRELLSHTTLGTLGSRIGRGALSANIKSEDRDEGHAS